MVRFQQVSDPVPAEFSLNTQFHVLKRREAWLAADHTAIRQADTDVAFAPGKSNKKLPLPTPLPLLSGRRSLNVNR